MTTAFALLAFGSIFVALSIQLALYSRRIDRLKAELAMERRQKVIYMKALWAADWARVKKAIR